MMLRSHWKCSMAHHQASSRTGLAGSGLGCLALIAHLAGVSGCSNAIESTPALLPRRPVRELAWHKDDGPCSNGSIDTGIQCLACDPTPNGNCGERCVAGDGVACALQGVYIQISTEDPETLRTSRALYERGCALGSKMGCEFLARFLNEGVAGNTDAARALALFEGGCQNGVGSACLNAGNVYRVRGPASRNLAQRYYVEGCLLEAVEACDALLGMEEGGGSTLATWARVRSGYLNDVLCSHGRRTSCRRFRDEGDAP